jgi:hypothetical protein
LESCQEHQAIKMMANVLERTGHRVGMRLVGAKEPVVKQISGKTAAQ